MKYELFADEATWDPASRTWTFRQAIKRNYSQEEPRQLNDVPVFAGQEYQTLKEHYPETPWQLISPNVRVDTQGTPALQEIIRSGTTNAKYLRSLQTEWHVRIARIFSCIILTFIAIPSAITFQRRSAMSGIGIALFLAAAMLFLYEFSHPGLRRLPPHLAGSMDAQHYLHHHRHPPFSNQAGSQKLLGIIERLEKTPSMTPPIILPIPGSRSESPRTAPASNAVIFDFDGLLVDTEYAIYSSWERVFASCGHPLPLDLFNQCLGGGYTHWNPGEHLEKLTGRTFDWETVNSRRQEEIVRDLEHAGLLPGAGELIRTWGKPEPLWEWPPVLPPLGGRLAEQIGHHAHFQTVVCRDDGLPSNRIRPCS